MNQKSQFQLENPLSSKKLTKKILQQIFIIAIASAFIGGFAGVLAYYAVIIFSGQADPSQQSIAPSIFSAIAGAFFVFVCWMLIYVLYIKAYINRYYYDGSEDFLTIKKGVFAPTEIHVQYQKIQDVYVDQDILDRILGLYDVHIASATATSGIEAHIDGVDFAVSENLKNYLLNKIRGTGNGKSTVVSQTNTISQTTSSTPIKFSSRISNETFPFSQNFTTARILGIFLSSVIYSGFIFLWLGLPGKNSDIGFLEMIGLNFASGTSLLVFLIVALTVCRTAYFFLWKKNFKFEFLPEYIMLKVGVVGKSENHMPYHTVQDVLVNQGLIDRLFGLANVTIQNAAVQNVQTSRGSMRLPSGVSLPGQTLENANKISEELKNVLFSRNSGNVGTGL